MGKMKLMILMGIIASLFGCGSTGSMLKNDTITYFSLSEGGGMNRFSGYRYSVEETKEGKVHFLFNEGYPDEKELTVDDHSVFDSLNAIIIKHKMYNYKDYYRPIIDVLDGTSWGLYVVYASGKTVSSGGYMAGPAGYGAALGDIIQCLDRWKSLPSVTNDVVSFVYEYGTDRYTMQRKDDHVVMTIDKGNGEHQELVRELEVLEDLRVFININQFKKNETRSKDLDFEYTPWMYEITYSNGAHYRYESYDTSFWCGYTEQLQYFISNCLKEKEERDRYYY